MEAQILAAWDAGARPRYTESDRWVLSTGGRRYAVLAQGPNITYAGHHLWQNRSWEIPAEVTLDLNTPPRLRGATEYIRTHNGRWVVGRRFSQGVWKYTVRGRRYYGNRGSFVVHVPCSISGSGARDWHVENTSLPIRSTMVPGLGEARLMGTEEVKTRIPRYLNRGINDDGDLVIMEASDTQYA